MSEQQTREKVILAALLELLSIVGAVAVVVLQDPGLRADAKVIARKVGLALIGEPTTDVPAPLDVRGVLDEASRLTKEAASLAEGEPDASP